MWDDFDTEVSCEEYYVWEAIEELVGWAEEKEA